ncbi:MAG: Asp-tRNA(Asn)/Glu-tRNA(Gln) amidotransferase subunit GatC [Ferruginibacter sp.]
MVHKKNGFYLLYEPVNPNAVFTLPPNRYFCSMEVNDELVNKLAHLSRLSFNESEMQSIKTDLQHMISFIDKLQEVNTDQVEPLLHITENVNVQRNDEVKGQLSAAEALKNAAFHDDHFFKVPKVIKK